MLDETRELLLLWKPGDSIGTLYNRALSSGRFPSLSARRLRNIIAECFAPRFLSGTYNSAELLRPIMKVLAANEFRQLCLIYTARANQIIADFIREVFWQSYAAGRTSITNDQARDSVTEANRNGRTGAPWSEITMRRVASYLTGTLADFGFLEHGNRGVRTLSIVRLEERVAGLLAHDLHFCGSTDSQIVAAQEWSLFGLEQHDVIDTLRRISFHGWFVFQAAAASVRLGWKYRTVEELADAICDGKL